MSPEVARELSQSFDYSPGVAAEEVTVLLIDMADLAVVLDSYIPSEGIGAVAYAIGDFVAIGATLPPGADLPTGRTALKIVAADGTLIGNSLRVKDIAALLDRWELGFRWPRWRVTDDAIGARHSLPGHRNAMPSASSRSVMA